LYKFIIRRHALSQHVNDVNKKYSHGILNIEDWRRFIMKFDEIDQKIIDCLVEDGRKSYVELAEEVGLSRVAVKDRIENVIDKEIIENFTITVNSEKIGKKVAAYFEGDVEPKNLQEVAENRANNLNVASIYQMTGPSTLHMHVLVKDFQMLETFINNELYAVEGITRVESNIILKRFKSRGGYKL